MTMKEEFALELDFGTTLRLLGAFQALRLPSGFFGITHRAARDIIESVTGKRPVGCPPVAGGLPVYLEWLFPDSTCVDKGFVPAGKEGAF